MSDMPKAFNPAVHEEKLYKLWEEQNAFAPQGGGEPFSMVLPPPNVTGTLHVGHALEDTLQDIIIRYERMNGKKTVWIPGTDHAAIATQAKFEKDHYKKHGKSRHDYSREAFVEMINEFAVENQNSILSKLHILGLSLDWSRLAFTLDEPRAEAVKVAFKRLYDAGVVYRDYRVVNWDVKGQTTVSDDEVVHETTPAHLYTFKYSADFPISIASTQPETKLGDTAVAVHPEDDRYKQYVGQTFSVEFLGEKLELKIIADEAVDPTFGTGALGVTPAHSITDWEMAKRHNLPLKPVINTYGKMIAGGEGVEGKKTLEARATVVAWLKEKNLLEKEEAIEHNVPKSDRTGGIIEPLPMLQWFIDVSKPFIFPDSQIEGIKTGQEINLKEMMHHVVTSGQVQILPKRFEKMYFHWVDNLRDWCISRQIFYGHQINAWYKNDQIHVDTTPPKDTGWEQDKDTFDTWFSSALWSFSTLGWPNKTPDLAEFHPNSVIMPGYEILFLWISRMILMSGFLLGQVPFHKVYLHGLVRDKQGRKFSKSLNNGVDPLEMIEKYGADALRMALVFNTSLGADVIFSEDKIRGMRNFANKVWNIARFITTNSEGLDSLQPELVAPKTEVDVAILEKWHAVETSIKKDIQNIAFHEAAQKIYDFLWHDLADSYIEQAKSQLEKEETRVTTQALLLHILINNLKLLHPFMPFVTEAIWQELYSQKLVKEPLLITARI